MNTEMKNYAGFSAKELLDDNYFIQSHKERTPESDAFGMSCYIQASWFVQNMNMPVWYWRPLA